MKSHLDWLQRIVNKANNAGFADVSKTVVLVCPALSESRFLKEGEKKIIRNPFAKKFDFVAQQVKSYKIQKDYDSLKEIWKDYNKETVIEALAHLLSIQSNGVEVL